MERSPRQQPRGVERRAEHRGMSESAKRVLLGLFALTTTACDPFGESYERGRHEAHYADVEAAEKTAHDNSPEVLHEKALTEFKTKLVELEKAGYTVDISGTTLSIDSTGELTADQVQDISQLTSMELDVAKINFDDDSTNPLKKLHQQLEPKDGRIINPDHTTLRVSIYAMHVQPGKAGNTVTVENWLTGKTICTEQVPFMFNPDKTYDQTQTEIQAALSRVKAQMDQDKAQLAGVYGKLLTDNGISINAMDLMQMHAGNGMETLATMFADDDVSHVTLNGFKSDMRNSSSPYVQWSLGSYNSDLPPTGTPEMNGTLTSISMYRYSSDHIPDWYHANQTELIYKDKYNNTIIVESEKKPTTYEDPTNPQKDVYTQSIEISVPTAFLDSTVNETDWTGWNVDLTQIGLPELTNFVYNHPEKPVAIEKTGVFDYAVYYQGDDSLTTKQNVYSGFYDMAAQGAEAVQRAFYGYEAEQQIVHNIVIVPEHDKNGYFTPRNSATIALTAGEVSLRGSADMNEVVSVARHESGHAIFNHLELDKNKEITALHKRLSAEFFKTINEKNWQDKGFGGHSEDNETEFFATFINSIMVNDLEARMHAKLTPALAAEYADAAKTVYTALEKTLQQQNGPYEHIEILEKLKQAETIANTIAAGK